MRAILIFPLFLHAFYGGRVNADDDKINNSTSVPSSGKHSWEVEKFLGSWSGDELFSHTKESFDDTCLRVKISEVNELGNEITFNETADKKSSSSRHLKLKFAYQTHVVTYSASINMTNVAFWKGENFTVQVLRFVEKRLSLTISESDAKLYTIILKVNDEAKNLKDDANEKHNIENIMDFKRLTVHSTAQLNVNCTAKIENKSDGEDKSEDEDDLSAGNHHFSLISIWILIFSRLLFI